MNTEEQLAFPFTFPQAHHVQPKDDPIEDHTDPEFTELTTAEDEAHTNEDITFFNPWRKAEGRRAKRVVEQVVQLVEQYDDENNPRYRTRSESNQRRFRLTIEAIVCDMIHRADTGQSDGVLLSRSTAYLGKNSRYKPWFIGKSLCTILDAMHETNLIEQEIGYQTYSAAPNQLTRIKPGAKLLELIEKYAPDSSSIQTNLKRESIILKSKKDDMGRKKEASYRDDIVSIAYRSEMTIINQWLTEANIGFNPQVSQGVNTHDRYLRRIFTQESFTSGGRLFGGFWQRMKKEVRPGIIINGEPTVELDYGQIAPRLLYSHAGCVPPEGDLYAIPELMDDPRFNKWRGGLKKLMNALLFRTTPLKIKPQGTADLLPNHLSALELANMLKKLHPGIAPYFETGIGHYLQFLESQVMVSLLLDLRLAGVVALPIHDAVIVPVSHALETERVMASVFTRHTGMSIPIDMKKSVSTITHH